MWHGIFLPESTSSADSLTVSVQFPCAIAHINNCVVGHTKILHTLIGMGSATLAAAVPYRGKATRIFRRGH